MALTDNLVAYWRLDEASGTRADQIGGFTLTDNNTVGSATGNISALAADFVQASSESLSTTNATILAALDGDASWTLMLWIYPDSPMETALGEPIGTYNTKGIQCRRRGLTSFGSSTIAWDYYNTAGAGTRVEGTNNTPVSTWSMISLRYDFAASRLYANTNGTDSAGVVYSAASSAESTFRIGNRNNAGGGTYWDGRVAHVGVWSRCLSGSEMTQLYNSGAGLDPTASTGSALPLFAAQLMAMR